MALQFRRGVINDLPDPSDAAIGEPLFTTDEGKLRIKKADGTYAVIGSGTSTGELDLSGIAAGSLVKVNTGQDGFVAAAGTDLPSHTQAISTINGLQDALDEKVELADLPQNPPNSGNLDIAQESTLQSLVSRTISAGTGLTGGGDLTADRTFNVDFGTAAGKVAQGNHTHAADTLTTTAQATGYLKWTWSGSTGAWSVADAVAAAPTFINGGDANADDPGT